MKRQTVALFGGTFDPIHLGHTTVAQAAADHLQADRVIFIPAKQSPLKQVSPRVPDADRLEMIRRAMEADNRFEVSDFEVKGPTPSYSLLTVKHFRAQFDTDCRLHWLVGADAVHDLGNWYGVSELLRLCALSVMYRADCETPNFDGFEALLGRESTERLKQQVIQTPLVAVSSTEVRHRIRDGGATDRYLDAKVYAYIKEKGLYQ